MNRPLTYRDYQRFLAEFRNRYGNEPRDWYYRLVVRGYLRDIALLRKHP